MILDTLDNIGKYASVHPRFKEAFAFLQRSCNDALPDGRIDLGDKMYANVQTYNSYPLSEGKYEMHKQYIDLQYLIEGEELIGYAPSTDGMKELEAYSEKNDCAFYAGPVFPNKITKGMFMVLFANEPHMPCRAIDKPVKVRKIVVKIPVA